MTVSGTLPDTRDVVDFAKLTRLNRKRKAFVAKAVRERWHFTGYCGHEHPSGRVCGLPQFRCPAGEVCAEGHGGASTLPTKLRHKPYLREEAEMARTRRKKSNPEPEGREVTREEAADPGFEVRDGDRLTIVYGGVKLQIAPYSSVELDSSYYSRTLEAGDDVAEQYDRIRDFLNAKATEKAREKLALYAGELNAAKRKANASGDE